MTKHITRPDVLKLCFALGVDAGDSRTVRSLFTECVQRAREWRAALRAHAERERLERAKSPAPFCRCIQCGAAAGEQCQPDCPAFALARDDASRFAEHMHPLGSRERCAVSGCTVCPYLIGAPVDTASMIGGAVLSAPSERSATSKRAVRDAGHWSGPMGLGAQFDAAVQRFDRDSDRD